MTDYRKWQGLIALPDPTSDGRLFGVTGTRELPLPLFLVGADIVGRLDRVEINAGIVWGAGVVNLAALPPDTAAQMLGDGVPVSGALEVEGTDQDGRQLGKLRNVVLYPDHREGPWQNARIRVASDPAAEPVADGQDDAAGWACWRAWTIAHANAGESRQSVLAVATYGVWRSSVPTAERNRWVKFASELRATGGMTYLSEIGD